MVATASTEHPIGYKHELSVAYFQPINCVSEPPINKVTLILLCSAVWCRIVFDKRSRARPRSMMGRNVPTFT